MGNIPFANFVSGWPFSLKSLSGSSFVFLFLCVIILFFEKAHNYVDIYISIHMLHYTFNFVIM